MFQDLRFSPKTHRRSKPPHHFSYQTTEPERPMSNFLVFQKGCTEAHKKPHQPVMAPCYKVLAFSLYLLLFDRYLVKVLSTRKHISFCFSYLPRTHQK